MQDEFEAEKKTSLHDKEQMFIEEREKAQAAHQKEQEMLSALLQERAAIITQVWKNYFKLRFLNVLLGLYFSTKLSVC